MRCSLRNRAVCRNECLSWQRDVRCSTLPDGPGDAGQFIGQCDGGLVVAHALLQGDDPVLQPAEDLTEFGQLLGAIEYGAGAVDEQHAHVAVAPFADAAEMAPVTGAIFLRRKAQPAGQVAPITEVRGTAGGGGQSGGGQQADTGDAEQLLDRFGGSGMLCEHRFDGLRMRLQLSDLVQELVDRGLQYRGQLRLAGARPAQRGQGTDGQGMTQFAQQPSQGVYAGGACGHPLGPEAVQGLHALLLDRFDGHR